MFNKKGIKNINDNVEFLKDVVEVARVSFSIFWEAQKNYLALSMKVTCLVLSFIVNFIMGDLIPFFILSALLLCFEIMASILIALRLRPLRTKRIENDVLTLTYSYSTQELYDGPANVIGYIVTDREIEITTVPIKLARLTNFTASNGWKLIWSPDIKIFDIDDDKKTIYLPTDKNNSTHSVRLDTAFSKDRYYDDPMVTDIGVLISEFLASIS